MAKLSRLVKSTAFSLGYAALWMAVGLGAVELYLRYYPDDFYRLRYLVYEPPMFKASDEIPYQLLPNIRGVHIRRGEFDVKIRTNSQGLREDREIAVPKPSDVFRIVTLGDSFCFDYGSERAAAFQAIAEQILNARSHGKRVEVVNMGYISGYSPDAAYYYFTHGMWDFQPDVVLHVLTHSNDFGNIIQNLPYSEYDARGLPVKVQYMPIVIDPRGGVRAPRFNWELDDAVATFLPPDAGSPTVKEFLLKNSRLAQAVGAFVLYRIRSWREVDAPVIAAGAHLGEEAIDIAGVDPYTFGTGDRQKGWEITQRIYREMNRVSKEKGAAFGVVLVPEAHLIDFDPKAPENSRYSKLFNKDDLIEAQKYSRPGRVVGHFAEQEGFAFLDSTPGMRADRKVDYYFPNDGHWNEAGNHRVGELLAEWVLQQGWVK